MRKSGERWKWNSKVINSSTRTKNQTLISLSKNVNNKTTEYKNGRFPRRLIISARNNNEVCMHQPSVLIKHDANIINGRQWRRISTGKTSLRRWQLYTKSADVKWSAKNKAKCKTCSHYKQHNQLSVEQTGQNVPSNWPRHFVSTFIQ